ncbi:facilitated trehalose transporter Tret1-like [Epargyreus clarus]|uniref:facilitated trehalose transporter Tret1-like n=1 Tax=Epargyreus clarus TaxID=520877 RepID=UPI003C2F5C1A
MFSFSSGIILAFPSVLNPAILSPNATEIKATGDQASWIAASHGMSAFVGFAIFSPLFQILGRKTINIILNVFLLIGWIVFYFSYSVTSLVCARLTQGFVVGGVYIIAVSLSESSHPARRGYYMSLKKVSLGLGSFACHSLGLVWTWRQIAAFGVIVVFVNIIMLLACPESPPFLALTGRFEECKKAFRWLFGRSPESEKELNELISAQMKNIEERKGKKSNQIVAAAKVLLKKDFLKPLFIVTLGTWAVDACGRYFMLAYTTQIMIEITGDVSISMYCAVVSDCLLIIALLLSCFTLKRYSRRTLTFKLGFFSAFLMFFVSATVILRSCGIIPDIKWLTPTAVLLHSFVAHVGLIPVTFTIVCEIFPLEYKGMASFMSGITFTVFYTITLKVTPLMIKKTGIEGTYAIYGLCVVICLGFLFFILPETKDRTLQDIEDEIRGVKRNINDVQCTLLKDIAN